MGNVHCVALNAKWPARAGSIFLPAQPATIGAVLAVTSLAPVDKTLFMDDQSIATIHLESAISADLSGIAALLKQRKLRMC
jgi:hypothetical protein